MTATHRSGYRAAASLVALLGMGVAGCGAQAEKAAAQAAFETFQTALFERDVEGIRWLMTRGSWPVVEHLPWDRVAEQQPLECVDVVERNGRFELAVRDPNVGNRLSTYVVVRENGKFRVDLLETTTFHHTKEALPGGATKIVPRQLSESEIGEIATREASLIR